MKIGMCWRIPRWRRGACSPFEADAIAAHVAACASCAAEVALEAALLRAAGAALPAVAPDRHEALWARLEATVAIEAGSRATRKASAAGRWRRLSLRGVSLVLRRQPVASLGWASRLGFATAALALGLSLVGLWQSRYQEPRPDPASRLDLSFWEPEPLVENPMGPMTERLLVLLEDKR
jgi:hypothetical protein